MLHIGDIAPDFALPNQTGQIVRLSDFRGKKVVVYFYLKDDTPACTKQACSFRDRYQEFQALNLEIMGISCDPPKSHREFIDKFNLPFQLLSDCNTKVANQWGAFGEKNVYGRSYVGIHRITFLLDESRKIQFICSKVSPADHASEIMKALNSIS